MRHIINEKNKRIMKELVEKVAALYADFSKDANAQIENGNKAAGTRARKASLEIEKAMKEFRKASLEASKK
ncbi:histone H1 [Bacteroides xylanisolvens]